MRRPLPEQTATMSETRAERFARALQQFEQDADVDQFVGAVFSDDAELHRPEHRDQTERGADGARQFWQQYRSQFEEIASTFSRTAEGGDLGLLEWTSEGRLATGRSIRYDGVSVLDFDQSGKVTRFATWYDTAAFIAPTD